MQHLDEGTIHAWLDGELPLEERRRWRRTLQRASECTAAVAEARGFIAASSRILTALDAVPGGVLPAAASTDGGQPRGPASRRRFVVPRAWMAAAAVLVLSTVTVIAVRPGSDTAQLARALQVATRRQESSAAPAEEKPQAAAPSVARAEHRCARECRGGCRRVSATSIAPQIEVATEARGNRLAGASDLRARRREWRIAACRRRRQEAPAVSRTPTPWQARRRRGSLECDRARVATAVKPSATITGRVTSEAGAPLASAASARGRGHRTITRDDGSYALASRLAREWATPYARRAAHWLQDRDGVDRPYRTPITHDFALSSNPLALNQVIVSGDGTTLVPTSSEPTASADSVRRRCSRATRSTRRRHGRHDDLHRGTA